MRRLTVSKFGSFRRLALSVQDRRKPDAARGERAPPIRNSGGLDYSRSSTDAFVGEESLSLTDFITRLCLCCVIFWATVGAAEARRSRPAMPDGPRVETYVPGCNRSHRRRIAQGGLRHEWGPWRSGPAARPGCVASAGRACCCCAIDGDEVPQGQTTPEGVGIGF